MRPRKSVAAQTRLYRAGAAVVSWTADADALEIADVGSGRCFQLSGAFAQAALRALDGEGLDPLLAALGEQSPAFVALKFLAASSYEPLDRPLALRLGGFDTLFVELTGACNERCLHCYADASPAISTALERDVCFAIVDDAAELGFARVQFTGGDPLLCEFLVDLVARTRALKIPVCEIYTNGLLLDGPLVAALKPYRPAFAFSIYSHDATTHDRITRTPGSHERTVSAIRLALSAGSTTRAAMIVLDENAQQIDATYAFLRELGVSSASASFARPVGRGARLSVDRAEEINLPRFNQGEGAERDVGPVTLPGKLCVAHDGMVYPCIFNRSDVLGDVRRRRLTSIAGSPRPMAAAIEDTKHRSDVLEQCVDRLQCFSCRLTAYALRCGRSPATLAKAGQRR